MRKLLLSLAVVAVAATSCQKDVVDNNTPMENITIEESVSPYAVSEEEALARLDAELATLYGEDTRASQRQVRSIHSVKLNDIAPATRSNDINVENLLYIVEFENNQGSAILGADERVDDVFAVLENSTITAEDFENAANGVNKDELGTYLAGTIANQAVEQASARGILPDDDYRVNYTKEVEIDSDFSYPILLTCWGNKGIYNDECDDEYGDDCTVLSEAVAMAQVALHNRVQNYYNIILEGRVFDRTILEMKRVGYTIPNDMEETVNNEVALYMLAISNAIGIDYTSPIGPMTTPQDMLDLLVSMGYNDVNWDLLDDLNPEQYFTTTIKDRIYTNEWPLIMSGTDSSLNKSWCWIIDGYKYNLYKVYDCLTINGVLISETYIYDRSVLKVHCDFGQEGRYNGYYLFDNFSWVTPVESSDMYPSYGDVAGPTINVNYNSNLKVLSYRIL